jgi:hypothetical protein
MGVLVIWFFAELRSAARTSMNMNKFDPENEKNEKHENSDN